MSDDVQRRPRRVTRRQLVGGMGAATFGGLLAGGASGFLGARAAEGDTVAAAEGEPIDVGVLVPVTGAAAADGQEMLRGLRLGAAEVNELGGVGGRPIRLNVLDAKDQTPEIMTNAMRKFVADRRAAVFAPFLSYTNVETPIVGRAGIPTFHVNTFQGNVDFAREQGFERIFQGCPSEIWYASGFVDVVQSLIDSGQFRPRTRTVSIVSSNDAYSISIARTLRQDLRELGWRVVQFDTYTIPQSEWGSVLTRVRRRDPDIVFQSDYFAGDEASFIRQFAAAPTRSLVYQQYAPSVPEYLELAGASANGVLWATTTGTITADAPGKRFVERYRRAYRREPGLSNAGAQYDLMRLWAQAASRSGDPYDFERVGQILRSTYFRGVNGAYHFGEAQTNLPYPARVKDPSIGQPLLTFQIQDGEQVLISPDPYTTGEFEVPPWLT